ncbi:class I SAM-dependent DNA methyltransferase [Allonocardiopsis opalescens]|uniref:Methyltransferase family protein n=1 Tax=Allonocardiopsis opalescens TaxID=1144618 RepID=A0A2T0Q1J0_9ACTN|nr:class I SAM-dependent methyltransferase [Allonocardiopsis opalescens]PRX97665.1 methyltransferase family protein [Allonocardiopsis opalescens]
MTAGTPGPGGEKPVRPLTAVQLFDALAPRYEEVFGVPEEQLAAIAWLLGRLPPRARVLDLGSGTGRPTARLLADAGHRVTGYDVSSAMVAQARERVPEARFEQVDMRALPDRPGEWDAVTAFFSMLQLPRAELDAMPARIARRLVPGGLLVFATVPADVEDAVIDFAGHPTRVTSHPAEVFPRLLRAAGLEVVEERRAVHHPPSPAVPPEDHLYLYARRPA